MQGKRIIDEAGKTITMEFSDGRTFGPIELNPTNDILTKIIGELVEKVRSLEAKTQHLP
ncbi:MAG TPA: hypothetical protein VGE85_00115 [Terracidiphilus sp.]|jgi:hypothetical protein